MRLGWYLARLRNMSPGEIVHRGHEAVKRAVSRHHRHGWDRFAGAAPRPLPGLRTRLPAAVGQHAAIAEAAAAIMAGRFTALGVSWPQRSPDALFPKAVWTLSPETGKSWPDARTYCFDIDFRQTASVGDIKYAWEINRLQMLQALAAQVAINGDLAALGTTEAAIDSWYEANPPFGGIGWASGIEVGLRAISLVLVVSFCGDFLPAATLRRIGAILRASSYWLDRFPSLYSSANNHLMAELAGRYLIALALGQEPAAIRQGIERQVLRQILPDGVGAEQTPSYGAFTAELALLCAVAGREAGTPFAAAAMDRLGLFADFVFWLGAADGRVANFGDDDEGRVLTLGRQERGYAASVAVAIRGFLGRAAPLPAPAELRHGVFDAPAGLAAWPMGAQSFATGGYSARRARHGGHELHLVVDHGPLGYLSIAAHGHADALSLLLSVDGLPVLVDPGTYRYQGGAEWRTWFRSTRAHNTLTLGGVSQSIAAGAFNWSHKAVARLDEATAEPWKIVVSHDGYQLRFGVRHQRSVAATADGLQIHDRLLGAMAPLEGELSFQLAADLQATVIGKDVAVRRGEQLVLLLVLPSPAIRIVRAGGPEAGGWVSSRFGEKIPADRIVWTGPIDAGGVVTAMAFEQAPA